MQKMEIPQLNLNLEFSTLKAFIVTRIFSLKRISDISITIDGAVYKRIAATDNDVILIVVK